MEMLERIRNRKMDELALQEDDGSPHFEDCKYRKFGNFREDFIFAKLRICEVL